MIIYSGYFIVGLNCLMYKSITCKKLLKSVDEALTSNLDQLGNKLELWYEKQYKLECNNNHKIKYFTLFDFPLVVSILYGLILIWIYAFKGIQLSSDEVFSAANVYDSEYVLLIFFLVMFEMIVGMCIISILILECECTQYFNEIISKINVKSVENDIESNYLIWIKLSNIQKKLIINKMNGTLFGFEISWKLSIKYGIFYVIAKIAWYYLYNDFS